MKWAPWSWNDSYSQFHRDVRTNITCEMSTLIVEWLSDCGEPLLHTLKPTGRRQLGRFCPNFAEPTLTCRRGCTKKSVRLDFGCSSELRRVFSPWRVGNRTRWRTPARNMRCPSGYIDYWHRPRQRLYPSMHRVHTSGVCVHTSKLCSDSHYIGHVPCLPWTADSERRTLKYIPWCDQVDGWHHKVF